MECREIRQLLTGYADGEVGIPQAVEVERHMQNCPGCRAEHATQVTLRAAIKRDMTYFQAPDQLAKRIRAALPRAATAESSRSNWYWNRLNLGMALASFVAIAWSVGLYLSVPSASDRLAEEAVVGHVRSLLSEHPVDVESSDRHTVKPWFAGKLDFAPVVYDLTAEGFSLIGGRLDYLDHRTVAALVYRYRQHVISLFISPAKSDRPISSSTLTWQGYHLAYWKVGDMDCWAVSDTDPVLLAKFKEAILVH
jgi:anti-sigma factor RsiW